MKLFILLLMVLCDLTIQDEGREDESLKCSVFNGIYECSIRTLSGNNLENYNEDTKGIIIKCSNIFLYESILGTNHFGYLPNLQLLELDFCKIRKIPSLAFSGLIDLKSLIIRSENNDWSGVIMEINADAFTGIHQLKKLGLASNNIQSLPKSSLCSLNSLTSLNLSTNYLQSLEFLKCQLPSLKILDLSRNSLQLISNGDFEMLPKMESLNISGNQLKTIEYYPFQNLNGLKRLNLANNQLNDIPPDVFSHTNNLQELYLQNNSIVLSPGLLNNLNNLLLLNLSRNDIGNDWLNPYTFSSLHRLIALDLSHNRLKKLEPFLFKNLTSLQILNLKYNEIFQISQNTFESQINLHILILSHNQLEALLSRSLANLIKLNSLSLDHNKLESLSYESLMNSSRSLQDLALNNNYLVDIPEAITNLSLLRMLDIGENKISKIENTKSLDGLLNLYGLRLSGNYLETLPSHLFSQLKTLQVLNLGGNRLKNLPQDIFNPLKELRMLRLDNNELLDINGLLTAQSELKWLNISSNLLQWFDYAFIPKQLKWLDIHSNEIEDLGNYYKLKDGFSLKTLDASYNKIKNLGVLSLPNSIEYVLLNDNNIQKIEGNTFQNKPNLMRVDIARNQIQHLQLSALTVSTKEHSPKFSIGENPYECDCEMEYLKKINQMAHNRQHPQVMDLDKVSCKLELENIKEPILKIRSENFLCEYQAHCFALCMCCEFFACDCRMQCPDGCNCFHDSTWSANVIRCSERGHKLIPPLIPMDATTIYLDGNNFTGNLDSQSFIGRKRVYSLYLNNSEIGGISNGTFNGLGQLETLDLKDNAIERLEGHEFTNLTSLKKLFLTNNFIYYINEITFTSLLSLEILNLDGNKLMSYPIWELISLPLLSSMKISNNFWTCECEFINKLRQEFMESSIQISDILTLSCVTKNNRVVRKINLKPDNVTCSDPMAVTLSTSENFIINSHNVILILVSSTALIVVIIVSLIMLYVFRTPLRIWIHSKYGLRVMDPKNDGILPALPSSNEKYYDAFLSYSLKDEDFVNEILIGGLGIENYKLGLQHRDISNGALEEEEGIFTQSFSSKHILVISSAFLETEWPRIKLVIPKDGKWKPILILIHDLSTINTESVPEFNLLLKTSIVLKWNETGFWNKLRYYLPDSNCTVNSTPRILNQTTPRERIISNPLELHSHPAGGGWSSSDQSESAYSWIDHTYQTIGINNQQQSQQSQQIYQTLDAINCSGKFNPIGSLDVMLPNGQMVPATLVRNANSGQIMPLVQVNSPQSQQNNHLKKTVVYNNSSRHSSGTNNGGYLV